MAEHALVAGQLAVIVVMGLIAAASVDIFSERSFGDESAHLAYVQTVAEDQRLPVLGEDRISVEVAALRAGRDPATDPDIEPPRGFDAEQYEAFQPPLYYLLAAPVFAVADAVTDDWFPRVKLLRAQSLAYLLAAAWVLFLLARRVMPNAHLIAFSAALMVLMWPGVLVMGATVSNASLELLAVACLAYALWRADSEVSSRWLLLSGLALGLGILTKFTVVALAPLLAVVAVRYAMHTAEPRKWVVVAGCAAIPIVVLAPWLAFNLDHYDALTPNGLAKQIQTPIINPTRANFGFGTFWSGVPDVFSGFYPLEWIFHGPERPKVLVLALEFVKAAVFGFPLLLLVLEPRWLKSRHVLLLAGPLVLAIAMIAYSTVIENWPLTLPRYVFPALPPLALFAALSWSRLLRPPSAPLVLSALCSLAIAVVWIDSIGRYL